MTPLQKFIAESQRICDAATEGPWLRDSAAPHSIKSHNGTHVATIFGNLDPEDVAFTTHARTALPAALQHLRDVMRENAELRQRIADMQDEARNPPTLRTVCEKEPDYGA